MRASEGARCCQWKANGLDGIPQGSVAHRPRHWSRLFAVALVLAAVFFVVQSLAPHTIGETARRKLLSELQSHYIGQTISIRRGHFDPKVGLTFEDIRVVDNSVPGRRAREMVRIDRMTVLSDMQPEKLLQRDVPLSTRAIVIDGLAANIWLEADQQLSLTKLLPLPYLGPAAPRMVLRRVNLSLVNGLPNSRPVTAELGEVVINSSSQPNGKTDRVIVLRGSADFADDLIVRVDDVGEDLSVRCSVKGAHLSRDLFTRLPLQWTEKISDAKDLQCVCDATLSLRRSSTGEIDYKARTTVHHGRFEHPLLPKPISQLQGVISCDPSGIKIEASQAAFGDAIVRATGGIEGYQFPCKMEINLSTQGLLLDDRLARSLPPKMQTVWGKLQPLGRVDVDATVGYSATGLYSTATIDCKGVDVRYDKFPYPVENVVGRVTITDGIAATETLSGRLGGNLMQCAFRLPIQPDITSEKSFVMRTDGRIPIDQTLLRSLSPRGSETPTKLESFVRSLQPRGSVQLASAVFRTDRDGRITRKIDLRIIDGHLRYNKFAYPLYNVSGSLLVENDLVTIDRMNASNANAGTIQCSGTYRMPSRRPAENDGVTQQNPFAVQDDSKLSLHFHARDIPMDESLRSSIPGSSQPVWDAIAPSGVLDQLDVVIEQIGSATPLGVDLVASQFDHPEVTSRSLSLRPTSLPYRLDVTGGTVRFDGKTVTIDSIRGRHDGSTLAADGFCVQDRSGRWELLLNLHSGSRLHPDAELIAALPVQMRVAMRALQLRGPVSVRGQTRFAMPDAIHPEPEIRWDLMLQLEGNRIADVGPVHSLRGELSVQGIRDQQGIRAFGDVRIDSMHVHDLQITGIQGPFSIDGDILNLGLAASSPLLRTADAKARERQSIQGRLFGGNINLDGKVVLSSGNFDVGLVVYNAQLPTVLADFGHVDNTMTGTLSGTSQLQGNLGAVDLLKGNGEAKIAGANLYKLPLLVQVFNLMRVKATEDVAFTDGEVQFTIDGDAVAFSELNLWGDLVALRGDGTLNGRRELDLTFETQVSPQNSFIQFVRPLGKSYTLGTIMVSGPLHSLQIERKGLERVSETLERWIPGMAEQTSEESFRPLRGIQGMFQ